jgi:3',5'-cyclic AMP phosphodiesterase CpdA
VRIAHLSDLHLLSLDGAVPFRLFNKRFTGYMNLRFHRSSVHKPFAVAAAARAIRALDVDHVVITGDVSNLALEQEFELVRDFLRRDLALAPEQVSIVPGNHDTYTAGSFRTQRFAGYFAPYLRSDLPGLAAAGNAGAFPFVHLRGPVAFIGLSTAWPRLPLVASGKLGKAQLEQLAAALAHPEVKRRTPVLLQHHPLHNPPERVKATLNGLEDARAEARVLADVHRGLLLHGHLHRRIHRTLETRTGHVDAVGATSASLLDERHDRRAGFNVYDIGDDGSTVAITSHTLATAGETFHERPIPRDPASPAANPRKS